MEPQLCPNCGRPVDPTVLGGLCLPCLARRETEPLAEDPPRIPPSSAAQPRKIPYFGDYELLEEVSRGGMGVVYRARQISLNREVAVKVILAGPYRSREFVRRFQLEAETIGQLRHPNIVTIFETGEFEGHPYFSMEFVPGTTLAALAGDKTPSPQEAAHLMITVARAVQYVHDRGVFHRDLKPTNVLLDERGTPRVTDFGVAKRVDKMDEFTQTGQILGTPAFISPEQISSRHGAVTNRSDVYSLGAILYFLLTGHPPFQATEFAELLAAVGDNEPVPPRRYKPDIPADIETICLQCLAKDPARRYESAEALARDLERWLEHRPIVARPVGFLEGRWLWMKRNPVTAMLCAVLFLSVAAGAAGILREWKLSEKHRVRAEAIAREMVKTTVRIQAQKAEELFAQHKPHEALAMLAANARLDPSNRVAISRLRSALSCRSFAQPLCMPFDDETGFYIALMSPDGSRIVTSDFENHLHFWNATSFQSLAPTIELTARLSQIDMSQDGGTFLSLAMDGAVSLWDPRTGKQQVNFSCAGATEAVHLSPDGRFTVVGMTNGELLKFDRLDPDHQIRWVAHHAKVNCLEYSRDGSYLVSGSSDHAVKIWDARRNFTLVTNVDQSDEVDAVTISPDNSRLLTSGDKSPVRLWDVLSGRLVTNLDSESFRLRDTAFSPDSARFALSTAQGLVVLYDGNSGRELLRYHGHTNFLFGFSYSPDGQRIASYSSDNTAQIWDVHTGELFMAPIRHDNFVTAAQFDPTGQRLMTGSPVGGLRLWDISHSFAIPERIPAAEPCPAITYNPDATEVWTLSLHGGIRAWNPHTVGPLRTIRNDDSVGMDWVGFDRNSRVAFMVAGGSNVTFFDLQTKSNVSIHVPAANPVQDVYDLSADGRFAAIASKNKAYIYDVHSGKLVIGPLVCTSPQERFGHDLHILRFSPDGSKLAAGCHELHALLWDATTGAVLGDFSHQGPVHSIEFSPDGRQLLTAAFDNQAKIWDLTNAVAPVRIFHHHDWLTAALFSGDGKRVLTGTRRDGAYLWDAATGAQIGLTMPHSEWAFPVAISRSGLESITQGKDGCFRRWDTETGLPLTEAYSTGEQPFVSPSPEGSAFALRTSIGSAQVWRDEIPPAPCPEWLPALAEGIAGIRYTTNGAEVAAPPAEFLRIRTELLGSARTDSWTRWAKWFLTDDEHRMASPDGEISVASHINSLLAIDRLAELREALRLSPTNALVLAHLAVRTLEETNNPCRNAEAAFLSQRAVDLAPKSSEVAQLRVKISALLSSPLLH